MIHNHINKSINPKYDNIPVEDNVQRALKNPSEFKEIATYLLARAQDSLQRMVSNQYSEDMQKAFEESHKYIAIGLGILNEFFPGNGIIDHKYNFNNPDSHNYNVTYHSYTRWLYTLYTRYGVPIDRLHLYYKT